MWLCVVAIEEGIGLIMFFLKIYCHDGLLVMDGRSFLILVELLVYVLFMFGVHESWIRLLNFGWTGLIKQAKQKLVMIF